MRLVSSLAVGALAAATVVDAQRWRVDERPAMVIGTDSFPPRNVDLSTGLPLPTPEASPYALYPIAGVVRQSNGSIVIAERGGKLKYFDAGGRHVKTVPYVVQGLRANSAIHVLLPYRGDSLLTGVRDSGANLLMVNVLDPAGQVARAIPVVFPTLPEMQPTWLQGSLADGSLIFRGKTTIEYGDTTGLYSGMALYYRVAADGSRADTIAALPVSEHRLTGMGPVTQIFSAEAPRAGFHGNAMYWGNGARLDVQVLDFASRAVGEDPMRRVIEGTHVPRPVGIRDRAEYERRPTPPAGQAMPGAVRPPVDTIAFKENPARHFRPVFPAYRTIVVDERGNIWLEHYRPLRRPTRPIDPDDVSRWTVFNALGAVVAELTLPVDLEIAAIGDDWVLGTAIDAMGTLRVRLHRLTKV